MIKMILSYLLEYNHIFNQKTLNSDISQWDIVLNIRNFANGNLHQEYITKYQQK